MDANGLQLAVTSATGALSTSEPGSLEAQIRYALTFVPTFAAVLVRVGAMFIFAPFFGSGRIPAPVKAAIAVVLAMALTPNVKFVVFPPTIYQVATAVAGEILFGLAMGMVMSIVFVAAQWAGEILGQQLGFTLGAVFDPQYGGAGSVVSDLLFMLTLVIFVCLRGHHAILLGLRDSFEALPLLTAGVGPSALELMTGLLQACTILALKLTAPVLAAMLVADVVLGFISRTMPQLNVMSAGTTLRGLLGLLIITAGLVFTNETMSRAISDSMSNIRWAYISNESNTVGTTPEGSRR